MGNIPLVVSREGARTAIREVRGAMASPDDFGAGIGRATQQLGATLGEGVTSVVGALQKEEEKRRNEGVANAVAADRSALDAIGLEARTKAPADGGGMETVNGTYDAQMAEIDRKANERFPDDPKARQEYKATLTNAAGGWKSKQVEFTYQQRDLKAKTDANTGLDAAVNRTRLDPSQYDTNLADAERIIDSSTVIPQAQKDGMKLAFRDKLGVARFESGMAAAKSVEDFDALQKELSSDKYLKSLTPQSFDRTLDAIKSSKATFMTQEGAKATAALTTMEARSKDKVLIPEEEMTEMAALAKNVKSPAIIARFQNIYQQQEDLKTYGKATPEQLRAKSAQVAQQTRAEPGSVGAHMETAASIAGVSPAIIQSVFGNEYSASAAAAGDLNRPNAAGASSARGMFQMIDGTFIGTVRANPGLFGDQTGRTDAQILAMRDNPENQAKAMGAFTKANVAILQGAGVAITAPNVYMLHFLGQKGGMSFLRALQSNPTADARSVVDSAAALANGSVFLKKNGEARSVAEVYDMFANKMIRNQGMTGAAYNRKQYFDGMAADKEKALKVDPISQARTDSVIPMTRLSDAASFAARGQEALATSAYYSIPTADMKPFTSEEALDLQRKLKEGTADDKLAILAQVQAMDKSAPGMATAALKQLGEEDTTTGHAAGLFYNGRTEDAGKIIRGADRIANDKTLGDALGGKGDAEREFNNTVGLGLNGVKPEQRMAIFNAARAHYIESNPGVNASFNSSAFRKSIKSVMGGEDSVASINGEPTVVPPGVPPERFQKAIEGAFNDQDYAVMSLSGQPPKYGDGKVASAKDIAYEGKLRWNGAGVYNIEMADGKFLISGETDTNGNALKYRFRPTRENVDAAIERQQRPVQTPTPATNAAPVAPVDTSRQGVMQRARQQQNAVAGQVPGQ